MSPQLCETPRYFMPPLLLKPLWICDNLHNDCNLTSSICTYNTHTNKTYMFDDQNQVQDLYGHLPMLNFFDFHYLTRQVLLNNSINLLAHLPFPQTCIWMAKACTKQTLCMTPIRLHTTKTRTRNWLYNTTTLNKENIENVICILK